MSTRHICFQLMPFVISVTQRALPVARGKKLNWAKFPSTSDLNRIWKTVFEFKIYVSAILSSILIFYSLFSPLIKGSVNGSKGNSGGGGGGGGGVNISGSFFLLSLIYRRILGFFPSFIIGVSSSKFSIRNWRFPSQFQAYAVLHHGADAALVIFYGLFKQEP